MRKLPPFRLPVFHDTGNRKEGMCRETQATGRKGAFSLAAECGLKPWIFCGGFWECFGWQLQSGVSATSPASPQAGGFASNCFCTLAVFVWSCVLLVWVWVLLVAGVVVGRVWASE